MGTIDLVSKIPWCTDTYIPPQTEKFYKPDEVSPMEMIGQQSQGLGLDDPEDPQDEVAMAAEEMRNIRKGEVQVGVVGCLYSA